MLTIPCVRGTMRLGGIEGVSVNEPYLRGVGRISIKINESIPNVGPAGGVWQPIVRRPEEEGELGRVVTVIYGRVVRRLVAPRELLRRCGGERRCWV